MRGVRLELNSKARGKPAYSELPLVSYLMSDVGIESSKVATQIENEKKGHIKRIGMIFGGLRHPRPI